MVDTPRGPAASMTSLTPYGYAQTINVNYRSSLGINRGTGADWFGPQNPIAPSAPEEVAGRAFNFMPGFNLQGMPRANEPVSFDTLRRLADNYDLLRLVIETRKDQLTKTRWKIRVKPDADPKTKDGTSTEQQNRINYLTAFFERPDGVNKWRPWLRALLEDTFVLDAASLYKRRTRGGQLYALEQVDGATIKVVLDDWGRTPQPYMVDGVILYPPAYQQVLAGLPAVNYSTRDILYRPFNKRISKAYGYSPVEQILATIDLAMRRQKSQVSYYTEGNIPEALIGTPENWTPDQIQAFQNNWDAMFSGNLAARRHAKFVPGGVAKNFIPAREPDLKNPLDDWLSRIICFAFSVSPQQLVTMMNRATAQTADTQAKEEGTEPLKEYIKEIIDDVIEADFNSPDLEMAWADDVVVDEQKQVDIVKAKVQAGLISTNRGRELIGEDPSDDPGANDLMVITGTGMVPIGANTLDGKKAAIDAGLAPDPTKAIAALNGLPAPDEEEDDDENDPPKPPKPPAKADVEKLIRAERLAMRKRASGKFKAREVIEPVPFHSAQSRSGA